ncbi:nuclear transport factor 2 family protein [Streptomyces sp. 900116325]
MNGGSELQEARQEAAINYFRLVDAGDPAVSDLFTDNAQMFFPKFGFATGKDQIGAFAQGLGRGISAIEHDIPGLTVLSSGNYVVIEGEVKGTTTSGVAFPDGVSSYGLFCNVFEFEGERIKRIHIYEDPDFGSMHTDGAGASSSGWPPSTASTARPTPRSATTSRSGVRRSRPSHQHMEGMVPQVHLPGEEAEVDFASPNRNRRHPAQRVQVPILGLRPAATGRWNQWALQRTRIGSSVCCGCPRPTSLCPVRPPLSVRPGGADPTSYHAVGVVGRGHHPLGCLPAIRVASRRSARSMAPAALIRPMWLNACG